MKIRFEGDDVNFYAPAEDLVILTLAKTPAGLRDMAARRGEFSRAKSPFMHDSFPDGAKGILAALTLAQVIESTWQEIFDELLAQQRGGAR